MEDRRVIKSSSKHKKSLRQALRRILFKGRRQSLEDVADTVGSGILRRDPSLCSIITSRPIASRPSIAERFDIDDDGDAIPDRFGSMSLVDRCDISSLASAVSSVTLLKPQLSMSSFKSIRIVVDDLAYTRQFTPHRPLLQHQVPVICGDGFSQHGSFVSLPRKASTLRIQTSQQSLRPEPQFVAPLPAIQQPTAEPQPPPLPRRRLMRKMSSIAEVRQVSPIQSFSDQQSHRSRSTNSSVRFADLPPLSPGPSIRSNQSHDQQISHFSSFCILDTSRPQCPVVATSKDLRYIFDIGDEFCLNNRGCEGASMDMITGWDASGDPITHLVLFSPLVIPSSGRSRFMLASLVDVTDFINDTASLPELDTISEESLDKEMGIVTPRYRPRLHSAVKSPLREVHYALSAEDLLGGCFVTNPYDLRGQFDGTNDDVWLNLATEEKKRSTGTHTPSTNSTAVSIDDILNDFMGNLQELYSDFFMLAKSPFDDDYYEICNVSPRVYDSKDYIHGHLSRTSVNDMVELSVRLAYDEPFTMLVRWGSQGFLRQLYCIPLFARVSTTWVCFLVDASMPRLWR